jgi:uncharacterized membrane protein
VEAPRAYIPNGDRHPDVEHPVDVLNGSLRDTFNGRAADVITNRAGSMPFFWLLGVMIVIWVIIATIGIIHDPFPYNALWFGSGMLQVMLMPAFLVGANRADTKRAAKATADHKALVYIAKTNDEQLRRLAGQVSRLDQIEDKLERLLETAPCQITSPQSGSMSQGEK